VHYLRLTNPANPEMLAVYPRRIGSNRPNPYYLPGAFAALGNSNLEVYENRHCGRANPVLAPASALTPEQNALFPQDLRDRVQQFVLSDGAAPPCTLQGLFPSQGGVSEMTRYPHVYQDARPNP
jgi:hypothetical protein